MAVALSAEQFERFITEVLGRVAAATPVVQTETPSNKRTIWDKGFNRVSKFAQGESAWPEWAFDFKTALGTQSVEMKEYLDVVEQRAEIMTQDAAIQLDVERARRINFTKINAELYEILVILTEGEAKMMVKATAAGDGVQAWSRLQKH